MKKKCLFLAVLMLILSTFFVPFTVSADLKAPTYTVLVLDTSGSHKFLDGKGNTLYIADTAIDQVKEAASNFSNAIIGVGGGNNYVAVVSYKSSASTVSGFTNDKNTVLNGINGLSASGGGCNIASALSRANSLLSGVNDPTAKKSVVLFTTGLANTGDYTYSGRYSSSVPGNTWVNTSTRKHIYAYSNSAYKAAQTIHQYANLYTVGLFQNLAGMPAEGQELVSFFKMFVQDMANPLENFNPVYNKNDIDYAFAQVCNNIIDNPFKDVTYQGYYFDAVIWAETVGITRGTNFDTFDPNEICSREQMVTFLWRANGSPAPTSNVMPFVDMTPDRYSYDAVRWAVEKGITTGTTTTTFSPTDTVTREQVVTFLWRATGCPAVDVSNVFTDVSTDRYSYQAILWAQKHKITTGVTATTFEPQAPCTRGQIITFLYRYFPH